MHLPGGTLPRLLKLARPRLITPSPTSAHRRCISREKAPSTPPYIGSAHHASIRLLSAQTGGASPRRSSCLVFHIGTIEHPLVISWRRTQLVHLPRGAPATLPYIGTPAPPPVIFYQRTELVHLVRGPAATPPYIGASTPALTVSYRRTQVVHFLKGASVTPPYLGTPKLLSTVTYRRT